MSAMTTDHAHNAYAEQRRALKAAYLMDACVAAGVTANDVVHFTSKQRRLAEKAARVRPASDETWRLAATLMARSEGERPACPFCGLGNPRGEVGPKLPLGHAGECNR